MFSSVHQILRLKFVDLCVWTNVHRTFFYVTLLLAEIENKVLTR